MRGPPFRRRYKSNSCHVRLFHSAHVGHSGIRQGETRARQGLWHETDFRVYYAREPLRVRRFQNDETGVQPTRRSLGFFQEGEP